MTASPDAGATEQNPTADASTSATTPQWPAVLTWQAHQSPRMESARVSLNRNRIKAAGRIVGGQCAEHPAFSASYDLVTDEAGVTRRLSMRTSTRAGERQLSISRDGEGKWLISDGHRSTRSAFGGALDVDVVLSPFFNVLAVRRNALAHDAAQLQLPLVYVRLPDLSVSEEHLTYISGPEGIHVISPVSSSTITVDHDGFVLDYPGLAKRI